MELIELLFKIVGKFVPISESSLMKLEAEARTWRVDLEKEDRPPDFIGDMYKKVHKPWPVRLLIAILYIPIVNAIVNSTAPVQDPEAYEMQRTGV